MTPARSVAALVGPLLALVACSRSPSIDDRAVTLHALAACAPGPSAFAQYQPLGDFQPQGAPPSLSLDNTGATLDGLTDATREIVVDVTDATQAAWRAHGLVPSSGGVDLLLLPFQSPCGLTDTLDARTGAAVGAVDETHVLVAGGAATGVVPTTALVDLALGTVRSLAAGLLVPRQDATLTAWSGGAVVAGGDRPDTGEMLASAEVFASAEGDFDGELVSLSEPRTRHGAAALVTGQTLLVGGLGADGAALGSLEIVDASSHRARTTGLTSLSAPRADPHVVALRSGEILVAGGVDASGAPVSTLEWLARDASAASRPPQQLVASLHEDVIALDAGGALAVIAPDVPTDGFQNVWVISADGGLQAATPIDGALGDVRLFAGVGQGPVLWTGDRWLVWQPWTGAFTALVSALDAAGPTGDPVASPEAGLGVWVDGPTVHALRSGTSGPYATFTAALLASDTAFVAPDRLAAGGTSPLLFDPTAGLSLQPGASVFLTDATFASFALDAQTPGAAPPAVVLRDAQGNETLLDASTCPTGAAGPSLHVERDGDTLRASTTGALVTCTVAPASGARVSIGFRGATTEGSAPSRIRAVTVDREPD